MNAPSRHAPSTQETRHDNWREAVASWFLPLDFEIARSTHFHGRGRWAQIADARTAEVRMCEHRVERRSRHTAAADGAAIKMLWLMQGSGRFTQGKGDHSLQADGWMFYDANRPYSLQLSEDSRFFSLLYTGSRAEDWARLANTLGGNARPTAGPVKIALLALRSAAREQHMLDPLAQDALLGAVLSLTESALRSEIRPRADQAGRDALRLAEARRFVLQHLDTPLGPDDIARALHVSRRSLYNLFAEAGLRPRAFIQNIRLERACEALHRMGEEGDSITGIALDHGFTDAAHFSRSFRERFGVSPSCYRASRGG